MIPMSDGGAMLSMPAVADDLAIHKLITVMPANAAKGLPVIQGLVSVVDTGTGRLLAMLDGPTTTGRRTAALSMLAIEVLAPAPPRCIRIVGTGAQARYHVASIVASYPDARIRVRGRSAAAAEAFCRCIPGIDIAADHDSEACDVVITCTTSAAPVHAQPASRERLVIAVGSFRPSDAEVDAEVVRASDVFVDDPAAARREAGDLLVAGVDWSRVVPLADALTCRRPKPAGPVLFKSVGCAAWDLAAARVALAADPPA